MDTDICIAGGGIAGLYVAYELKKRAPALRVHIYETLCAVGGRVQTDLMLDGAFRAEYGAVRIEPDLQPLVDQFVRELRIPVEPISSHEAGSSLRPDMARLWPEERSILTGADTGDAAWILLMHAVRRIVADRWDLDGDRLGLPGRDEAKRRFRIEATFGGLPLHRQGMWNILSDVLSYEAVEFAREKGAFYNFKNQNPNAADWISLLLDMRLISRESYIPVGGMQTLIDYATRVLLELGVEICEGHKVVRLRETEGGRLNVDIERSSDDGVDLITVSADRVILALPQFALQELAPSLPVGIRRWLPSVIPFPITWACYVVEQPWWGRDTPPGSGEGAPIRASHFESHRDRPEEFGMAMFYSDDPWHHYWANLIEDTEVSAGLQDRPVRNRGQRLHDALVRTLQLTFGRSETPKILEWGIRDWSRPPFGAGVHFWKPGYDSETVMHDLAAFALGANPARRTVHICGEAYSECQGFFEGALRSARRVLNHVGLPVEHETIETNERHEQ